MLIRKTTPPPEPPPPVLEMPRSLPEVDVAILAIEAERTRIHAALATLPGREAELFEADAADDDLIALEIERKRNERALERLDRKEGQLVRVAEQLQDDAAQAAFSAVRERYARVSRQVSTTAAHLDHLLAEVAAISQEAGNFMNQPLLPPVGYSSAGRSMAFDGHLAVLMNQAAIAERTPAKLPSMAPQQQTYAVRFKQWTEAGRTAYHAGKLQTSRPPYAAA